MSRAIFFRLSAAALAAAAASPAHAAVIIDNFDTTQNLQVGPAGLNPVAVTVNVATGANAVGGFRFVQLQRNSGSGISEVNINSPVAGVLGFSNDEAAASAIILLWDGNSNNLLDHAMAVDLSEGGLNNLIRVASRSDLIVNAVLTVYSGAGNSSTVNFNTPGGGTFLPFTPLDLPFAAFSLSTGSGANFANVTAITLTLSGPPSFDGQFDFLQAIPSPGSGALALLGLAAILRRRPRA